MVDRLRGATVWSAGDFSPFPSIGEVVGRKKKRLTDEIFPPHIHTGGSLLEKFQSSHRLTDMLWLRWEGGWVWGTAEAGCEEYPLFRRRAELHCVRSH